jgi:FKBP-type peptidyl-prolyl cis-trans isomerase FklB
MIVQFGSDADIDIKALLAGLAVVINGGQPLLSADEATQIIQLKQQQKLAEATAAMENKIAESEAFLEQNKSREGVTVTASGIQYEVLASGDSAGASPSASDTVVVHYHGTLIDGSVFDSSIERGEPATFSLGGIIPGWQEVLQLMNPGDKWVVVLPPNLAYGESGAGGLIGPNEVLIFEIELLEVKLSGN